MKKNMIFSGAMSWMTALLLCTACSSDDVTTDKAAAAVPEGKVIHYTATVGEGDETRATLNGGKKYEYQVGDKLVITGTDISGELTLTGDPGTTATFEGDLTYTGEGTPADNLELKAVLVSESNAMTTLTFDTAEYPTTAIASTLAEAVEKYSHFIGTSSYADKSFSLSQQTSFLNFTVTLTAGFAETEYNVTITNGGSTVRTGSVTTAEVDSKLVAQFVAAMPKGATMNGATVQLGSMDVVSFGGTTILDANKIYNINKTMGPSYRSMLSATSSDVGKVICSNGHIHTNVSDVTCFGGTAEAMIAYVGTESSCSHGLAIALADACSPCNLSNAVSTVSSTWASSHGVSGGDWRLPSGDDWKYMFTACGGTAYNTTWNDTMSYSYGNFREKLKALNYGYDVQNSGYWCNLREASGLSWTYDFAYGRFYHTWADTHNMGVRAVLAF